MEHIFDFTLIIGIVFSSIIIFFLSKRSKKELHQYLLITLFSFIIYELFSAYTVFHKIQLAKFLNIVFSYYISLFIGPLIFIYIKSLFVSNDKLIKKDFFHFIPFIVYLFYKPIIYIVYFQSNIFNTANTEVLKIKLLVEEILSPLYFIFYLLLSLFLFNKYKKAIKSNYSNLTEFDFNWIRYLLTIFILVIGLDLIFGFLGPTYLSHELFSVIALDIGIIYLGYYGINQSRVLLPDFLVAEINNNEDDTKKSEKHQLSSFSEHEIEELKLSLENIFKNDRPYLDENLTLKKLADLVSTSDKKLSTLLNQYMNISFYDIINKYRVEAVIEKMTSEDSEKYSLIGIAYDCGFSSKSSFNRIFKKETGFSPSEYKEQSEP